MRIGILGTSMVGQSLSGALADLGHDVMVGTRDVGATEAKTEPDRNGFPAFGVWHDDHPAVRLGTFEQAAAHGEFVINATNGMSSPAALALAGAAQLEGKILIDVSNPLDFSHGSPAVLSVSNTDSLGEQIQRAYPGTRVVKTLNTVTTFLMVNPGLLSGADHTLFICGDDADAKSTVTGWLREWFGWKDIIDLGDITNARGTEQFLPLWMRLFGALGTGMFTIRVVRD
jgi:8-hydroxy-5-deazaflavin:NADPH oxidoreductase